mmetsp:Transcript_22492/g.64681  ORF Transcript_22492/g.64681 Transcript_22492/m.64681 type:complete len:542 (+) Transcript_22492:138-1763(+)|eukprot:CAMPEP_0181045194 /NCGR_PEP_ID=MMETSP1070-20121207/13675_1 /TAXON_ID=265543 /ORGANISM="Minutocellus polymorphus, Strain NH13" /LENGTH=541 /DNA_ID=CAMNT_0023123701 /DNA_START=84 /DNA_END=1709 /DNA_ORIENTATION=-
MSAWGKRSSLRSCDALLGRVEANDPSLIDLAILPLKTFTSDDCLRLASAIRSNGTGGHLRSIHASGHAVSTEALQALGTAIACTGTIVSLAIGDAQMGDEGIEALCRGLSYVYTHEQDPASLPPHSPVPSLQVLDLSYKGASNGAMRAIGECLATERHSSLISLDLSRNEGIGENGGIDALLEAFGLACSRISSGDNDASGCCVAFRHLRTLNLAQCSMGFACANKLVSLLLANVKANVKANDKPIDDGGDDKPIDGGDDTDIDNTSTIARSRLELVMNSNPIGSNGCKSIGSLLSQEGLSVLSSLSMVECNVGNDGVSALVEAAKGGGGCSGLVTLDLSSNQITREGATILSAALAVENGTALLSSLRELRLSENDIGGEGVGSICRTLVQAPQWKGDDDDESGSNRTLSILELCKTNCGAIGVAAAIKCGALKKLRLFGNRMGSPGIIAAAPLLRGGHPSLVELDVGGNDAKEEAVENLLSEIIAIDIDHSFDSTLLILEIGGNEIGESVELALKDLKAVRPELDVARDKPKTNNSHQA